MRLVMPSYGLNIEFVENKVNVLTIENRAAFADILGKIWIQYNGTDGEVVLSDQDILLKISKEVECIFNIYSVNCNDKKILTKLYQELSRVADEDLLAKTTEVNRIIIDYLDNLLNFVPYSFTQNLDLDIGELLKLYNVKVDLEPESILENIIDYIRLVTRILGKKIFIFADLKHYMSEEDLKSLYEFVFYEKIYLFIIEGDDTGHLDGEKHTILDKDLCIIDI